MLKKVSRYKTVTTCVQCSYYRTKFGGPDLCLGFEGEERDKDKGSIIEDWCPLEDAK